MQKYTFGQLLDLTRLLHGQRKEGGAVDVCGQDVTSLQAYYRLLGLSRSLFFKLATVSIK